MVPMVICSDIFLPGPVLATSKMWESPGAPHKACKLILNQKAKRTLDYMNSPISYTEHFQFGEDD